jgi:membrane protease YdiL (CAAX protease family)
MRSDGAGARDDRLAVELRGFGTLGVLAIVAIMAANLLSVPLAALLVLAWAWRSRTPWPALGYARPRNWTTAIVGGLVFGVALKLVMKAIVMPLLGADPINHAYHYLVGNRRALPGVIALVVASAGFAEETVYRGYLFERVGKIVGEGRLAQTFTVLLTSALFGIAHYADQGPSGVGQATIVGLVFGASSASFFS